MKNSKNNLLIPYFIAVAALLLALLLGILLGGVSLSLSSALRALFAGDLSHPDLRILLYVRLPRTLGAALSGGALALAGAVLQGVLANRLASPSVIGVNAGAGFAVTVASALGIFGGWRFALFAFLGALLSAVLVSLGARKWGATRGTVILLGVAVSSLFGACSDAVVTFFPDALPVRSAFRIGDFSGVSYQKLLPAALVILLSLFLLLTLSRTLDVLLLGEETATGLGLRVPVARGALLVLAAALAGASVSLGGLLSFVGLLVPHAVRRVTGGASGRLLPLSFLFGAAFVSLADTLSRTLLAPYEIPVGIPIALIGAPFFVFLLLHKKGGDGRAHA